MRGERTVLLGALLSLFALPPVVHKSIEPNSHEPFARLAISPVLNNSFDTLIGPYNSLTYCAILLSNCGAFCGWNEVYVADRIYTR